MAEFSALDILRETRTGQALALVAATFAVAAANAEGKVVSYSSSVTAKPSTEQVNSNLSPDSLTSAVLSDILPSSDAANINPTNVDLSSFAFDAIGACQSPSDTHIMNYQISPAKTISENCDGTYGNQPDPTVVNNFPAVLKNESSKVATSLGLINQIAEPVEFTSSIRLNGSQSSNSSYRFGCPDQSNPKAAEFRSALVISEGGDVLEKNCPVDQPPQIYGPILTAPKQVSSKKGLIAFKLSFPGPIDHGAVDLIDSTSNAQLIHTGSNPEWQATSGRQSEWLIPKTSQGKSSGKTFYFEPTTHALSSSNFCASVKITENNENSGWVRTEITTENACTKIINPVKPSIENAADQIKNYYESSIVPNDVSSINVNNLQLSRHALAMAGKCNVNDKTGNILSKNILANMSGINVIYCNKQNGKNVRYFLPRKNIVYPVRAKNMDFTPILTKVGADACSMAFSQAIISENQCGISTNTNIIINNKSISKEKISYERIRGIAHSLKNLNIIMDHNKYKIYSQLY